MLGLLSSISGLLKASPVCNDTKVFRLHYKATSALLLVCCLLVTSKQYVGDPIDCIVEGVRGNVMDTYCWIHSTFSLPRAMGKEVGSAIPYPGVDTPQEGDEVRYHKYYQWVCFLLFFQAMLFHVPHYLWKMWEGGKCQMLVMGMQSPVAEEDTRRDQLKKLTEYFHLTLHHHNLYAVRFFVCELLNFVNVVAQIFFTDLFLGYEFMTYGPRVVQYATQEAQDGRPDPMALVFPKVTKCTFHKYGASGTVQRIDGLCVLSINILNEKIYVLLWFWFTMLAAVSALAVLYRLAVLLSPQMRLYLLIGRARLAERKHVATVARKSQIGDWFILCQMGKNMDPITFKELISRLALRSEGKDPARVI